MPAASIQNVIKLCKDSKTESKPSLVDLKGPGGSVILVSLVTDNFTKSKQTLNTLVRKSKLTFSNGGWHHLFSYKGIIEVALLQNSSLEEALNHALDVGADDILEVNNNDEKCVQFMCEPGQLQAVKTKLEELKYIIRSADCEYIPNIHVALSDSDLESINYLYKKLQENPDVVNIYDNIAWDNCS